MERKIFGTDGIRGVANQYPMTPEMALSLGKAIAQFFKKKNGQTVKVVIGKDTRLSGYMLESALQSGLVSMGARVLLVGPMPTPAIAHLTKSLNANAKLTDEEEKEIEQLIFNQEINGTKIGKAFRIDDAKGRYIEFAKASIKSLSLKGLKIVLDCANGAAYHIAPEIFSELGAEVVTLNNQPDGLNINLDCGATHPEVIQKAVVKEKADLGIALDGDADRVIVCDEKGQLVDGDHIVAICALHLKEKGKLKNDGVTVTVMSNAGFNEAMEKAGIKVYRAAVGDRYVLELMKKEGSNLGGEQSGHIIFSDYATTGDGIITALQLMAILKTKDKKLSELSSVMKTYPQELINIKVKEKKPLEEMKTVQEKIKQVEEKLGKSGRVLVRYSGTENKARVLVEGQKDSEIKALAQEIAQTIEQEIGA
jgi:phosphoglucosamine mutase